MCVLIAPVWRSVVFISSFFLVLSLILFRLLWRAREYWFLNVNFVFVAVFFRSVGRIRLGLSRIYSKECMYTCLWHAVCRVNVKRDIEFVNSPADVFMYKVKAKRTKELKMVVCA